MVLDLIEERQKIDKRLDQIFIKYTQVHWEYLSINVAKYQKLKDVTWSRP